MFVQIVVTKGAGFHQEGVQGEFPPKVANFPPPPQKTLNVLRIPHEPKSMAFVNKLLSPPFPPGNSLLKTNIITIG